MTKTLTTERLREILERWSPSLRWGEAEQIAAELLANREAQPVAVPEYLTYLREPIISNVLADDDNSPMANAARILAREVNFWRSQPLFTAPPAPAVPDGITPDSDIIYAALPDGIVLTPRERAIAADLWNACRAAMLAQPVSQGYKLPDNVREALTLALQAMEFMGDTLNNIDAVCTEDVEYVTPAFTAVRGLLAAAPEGGNEK